MASGAPATNVFKVDQKASRRGHRRAHQATVAIETGIRVIGLVSLVASIDMRRYDLARVLVEAAANIASNGPLRG